MRSKKNLICIQQPNLISLQGDHNRQGKCHTISIPNLIGVSETSSNNKAQEHQDPVDFRNVDSTWDLVWCVDNLHSWKATQGYRLLYYWECGRDNCLTCSNSCHCCKCKHWPIESIWRKCQKQNNTLYLRPFNTTVKHFILEYPTLLVSYRNVCICSF